MVFEKLDTDMQKKKKRRKLDHILIPYTRIYSKWIIALNVRLETTKLLEDDDTDNKISDISLSNIFSDISPQTRETR